MFARPGAEIPAPMILQRLAKLYHFRRMLGGAEILKGFFLIQIGLAFQIDVAHILQPATQVLDAVADKFVRDHGGQFPRRPFGAVATDHGDEILADAAFLIKIRQEDGSGDLGHLAFRKCRVITDDNPTGLFQLGDFRL